MNVMMYLYLDHISYLERNYDMKYQRLLSIGGHHLDAELMGGPLLIKYAQAGAHCTMMNVTEGRLDRADASEEEKEAYLQRIRKENKEVAIAMGCDHYNFGYTSQTLPSQAVFIEQLIAYIKQEKVDCIVTHWRGTMHPRHYYTYETVTQAVLALRKEGYDIQLLYGENCEDLIGFTPTCYVTLTKQQVQTWFTSLAQYSIFNGLVNDMPYQEYYRAQIKVRAVEGGSASPVKAYMHAPLFDNE